jgi:glycerol uptake operon antiterminator
MAMDICSVIPAARGFKELDAALASDCETIFLLYGELIHLKNIMQSVRRTGKKLFLHIELLKGIKEDEASIHYLAKELKVDGIISTRTPSLICAKKYGLKTIQRGFLIDSQSLHTIIKNASIGNPDYIELLPGFSYPMISQIKQSLNIDIIMGGFINEEDQVDRMFKEGAIAVSTSHQNLWKYSSGKSG